MTILCASFSITSWAVSVSRFKADLKRPATSVGMKGLMLLSVRVLLLLRLFCLSAFHDAEKEFCDVATSCVRHWRCFKFFPRIVDGSAGVYTSV